MFVPHYYHLKFSNQVTTTNSFSTQLGREEHVQGTLDLPEDLHPVAEKVASTSTFIDNVL
jgi:hypothetical protein